MSWSVDFDNRLIELVRANPSLYEKELRSTPYECGKKKRELWCSIATSLKTDAKTCMTRWNYMRDKLRKELTKEQSDWSLLDKLRFVGQHKPSSNRNNERQVQQALVNVSWRALSPNQLIEQDEDDALQEAMDEQHVATTAAVLVPQQQPPAAAATTVAEGSVGNNEDLMKRIEALLQGLGANRSRAEKKIVAYLCKCTLRSLNEEQIDDIFI